MTIEPQNWSQESVHFLGVSVLAFFVFTLVVAAVLLWRAQSSATEVTKLLGLLTIVGISSFLLVVGYTSEQLTPVMGLFGAIVGYILGKDAAKRE